MRDEISEVFLGIFRGCLRVKGSRILESRDVSRILNARCLCPRRSRPFYFPFHLHNHNETQACSTLCIESSLSHVLSRSSNGRAQRTIVLQWCMHLIPMSRTCCTSCHYIALIRTVTVFYGDARTDTENIRSFMGVSATPACK